MGFFTADLLGSSTGSKLVVAGTAATVSGIIYGAWKYNSYLKNKPPTNWVKVGEVSELCIYPVKSLKAFKPDSFECTPLGPRVEYMRDRLEFYYLKVPLPPTLKKYWMFVVLDLKGKVVSGRLYPKMCLISAKFDGSTISLSSPDYPTEVTFSLTDISQENPTNFEVWSVPVHGWDCGDEVAAWLSRCILQADSGLRLVYYGQREKGKGTNPKIAKITNLTKVNFAQADAGFYSDSVSYHLISDTSIQYLNSRASGEVVSPLNFRPNFVVKGESLIPFEEDNWEWVKIGDVVFQCISPTTRCVLTTVNPATGEKSQNMEPLKLMKRFRNLRDSRKRAIMPTPAMGIYVGLRESKKCHVSVGDPVYVPEH